MGWRNTKGYYSSGWILYYYIHCPQRPDSVEVARGVWSSHTSLGMSGEGPIFNSLAENIPPTQPRINVSRVRYPDSYGHNLMRHLVIMDPSHV